MNQYRYSFRCQTIRGETFFRFPKFPEIFSSLPTAKFRSLNQDKRIEHAADAVLTALQTRMAARHDVPKGDHVNGRKGDFVALSVPQAMKIELYRAYRDTGASSVADFARRLKKSETLVRRLFDLRHSSLAKEIEDVITALDMRLVHSWSLEPGPDATASREALDTSRHKQAGTRHASP